MLVIPIFADTYYIDSVSGDDGGSGNETQPFQTLSKITDNNTEYKLKRGSTFKETITLDNKIGINISCYDSGSFPLITGTESVSSITQYNDTIYYFSGTAESMLYNGSILNLSSEPEGDFYTATNDSSTNDYIIDINRTYTSDEVINSSIVIKTKSWKMESATVESYDVGLKKYSFLANTTYDINTGETYYLENKLWMLDMPGEYYVDSTLNRTYFMNQYNTTPNVSLIDYIVRDYGIDIDNSFDIIITNVNITSVVEAGIRVYRTDNVEVDSVYILDCEFLGIYYRWVTNSQIKNNYLSNIGYKSIKVYFGDNVTISNNTIYENGYFERLSDVSSSIHIYGLNNSIIHNNSIYNSTYHGISINTAKNNIIENNYINSFCNSLTDGGGIYSWGKYGTKGINNTIQYNLVIGSNVDSGHGIYMDDWAEDFLIKGNIVSKSDYGFFSHNGRDLIVEDNIMYDNLHSAFRYSGCIYTNCTDIYNITAENNFFLNSNNSAYSISIKLGIGGYSWVDFLNVTTFINNTYTAPSIMLNTIHATTETNYTKSNFNNTLNDSSPTASYNPFKVFYSLTDGYINATNYCSIDDDSVYGNESISAFRGFIGYKCMSCRYNGSGNYAITDDCTTEFDYDIIGNNVTIDGANVKFYSSITNYTNFHIENSNVTFYG